MRIVCLDFESYWDDQYTLKKMTTEAYIRDPRFEAFGCGVYADGYSAWWRPDELRIAITAWKTQKEPVCVLCHHAQFDGLILSHHFDYKPDFWLDTLSMGRVVFDGTVSLSLESLSSRFGLAPKTVPYNLFKGYRWDELIPGTQMQVAAGAQHDCALTWQCAKYMLEGGHPAVPYRFPESELPVVDLTVRMFTEPYLIGDLDLLAQAWIVEEQDRQALFTRLGTTPGELRKDDVFAAMLTELGIEPGMKLTPKEAAKGPGIGKEKYAFAKSDYFMQDLLIHEDQDVALLAEARLKAQSSIYQTRCERLGWTARRGPMPVYLGYAAAHTRRWGGGDKMNWQNFPRSDPLRPQKGALRRAIKAPP